MDIINKFLLYIDQFLGSAPYFPFLLLGVGIFFTLYLNFPQIRYFRHAWKVLSGRYADPKASGDTSHFQALATALSGTVGTGNIGGVGFAIYLGGPAALFWMWMTAFVGMTTKFVEVTLSHKYREKALDGTIVGGPMFVMEKRLNMKWLGVIFGIATLLSAFGVGCMPQSNNIAIGLENSFMIPPYITGVILSLLLALVILGGIQRISKVAAALVPAMSMIYILGALSVILLNIDQLEVSFYQVFHDAFTGSAAAGGFLGATFAYAFNRGVNRGLFSNEAGMGSAPIAHASARTTEPVAEGMVAILEPFIDTIIICTLTGLAILSSGVWTQKHENNFQRADMVFVQGDYTDERPEDQQLLLSFLSGKTNEVIRYNGSVDVLEGKLVDHNVTLLAARSIAEDIVFKRNDILFSGVLDIKDGALIDPYIQVSGYSLLHSTRLTSLAFTQGYFGEYGGYIVSIGLLLFAFSTAIAWSYYGDRSVIYLVGMKGVVPFRMLYIFGFFIASVLDTTVIWNLAAITVVLMALPNLFGLLMLHREMKLLTEDYWQSVKKKSFKKAELL